MSLLSVTDIVIIAATIGGVLILVVLTAIVLLVRRRIGNHKIFGFKIEASTEEDGHWHTNEVSKRRSGIHLSPPLDKKTTAQIPDRSFYLIRLFRGLSLSRHRSALSSEWAVKHGGHVPRPHRLRKSRGTIGRNSWLSVSRPGVDLPRSAISSTYGIPTGASDETKQPQTVKARMARISGPSGTTHIVSMILEPEHDINNPDLDVEAAKSMTSLAQARTSWQSVSRPRNSLDPLDYGSSPINTPGSWSYSLPRARRSMSLPYVPSSQPPSSAAPPIPSPSYHRNLLIVKRTVNANGSPSKRSFASRTTDNSSVFDGGISASLRKDLEQMSKRAGRSNSGRKMYRQTSAPGLKERQVFSNKTSKTTDTLGRRSSGASSQLLPSPARPVVREQGLRSQEASASKPCITQSDGMRNKRISHNAFRVKNRDLPVSFIGMQCDWDVFGNNEQTSKTVIQDRVSSAEPFQPELRESHSCLQDRQSGVLSGSKSKVLRKQWTKQDSYTPLSFAAIAYSSAVSLDTPVQVPVLDEQVPSVYSISSGPVQQGVTMVDQSGFLEQSSMNDPFVRGNSHPRGIMEPQAEGELQSGPSSPKQGPFGPRQMPAVVSRASHPALTSDCQDVPGNNLVSSNTVTMSGAGKPFINHIEEEDNCHQRGGVKSAENQQTESTFHNDDTEATSCISATSPPPVDPPPVRFEPARLRRSFYSYEAVPYMLAVPNRPPFLGSILTVPSLPIPARTVAAPRPPSSLSNNFRASALYRSTSRRSSAAESRLSERGSTISMPSRSLVQVQAPLRPVSTEAVSLADRIGDARISRSSSILENVRQSSTYATPLHKYSNMCDLFPRPLSVKSTSRPPTWVLPQNSQDSKDQDSKSEVCSRLGDKPLSLPHALKPGLPPHPRFFIEQDLYRTSIDCNPIFQYNESAKHNTFDIAAHAAASLERPSSRKCYTRAMTSSTQMASSITNPALQSTSTSISVSAQTPESSAAPAISDRELPLHKQATSPRSRNNILEPISVNIGSPTQFTANKGRSPVLTTRYRETAPSPSTPGSTRQTWKPRTDFANASSDNFLQRSSQANESIYGTIGQERQKTNGNSPTRGPVNPQLKQRINQARQRKIQAQAQAHAPIRAQVQAQLQSHAESPILAPSVFDPREIINETSNAPTGLGITIPMQSYIPSWDGIKNIGSVQPSMWKAGNGSAENDNAIDMLAGSANENDITNCSIRG